MPRRRGCVGSALRGATLLALLGVIGAVAWMWPRCAGPACPSVEALRTYRPPQATRVFDADGRLLAYLAPERRVVVPLERIPAHVVGAFLAIEDKRFFQHHGVDYVRVLGAMWRNLRELRFAEGFSTITMQLARNVFPDHLTRDKTLRRKLWEVVLAYRIERAFSKHEILEMYLNQIYLGEGLYGVEAAAQGYFGKPVRRLTLAEAALLAALPRAPSYYSPRRNPEAAVRRRNLVLARMAATGVVSAAEAARAQREPLRLAPPPEASATAPYFVAAVRRQLRARFGPEAEVAGLRVYTGLDRRLQRAAELALARQLRAIEQGAYGRFRGPRCGVRGAGAGCLQGLVVVLDARTGEVRAWVGGRNYATSPFDRVDRARRQAGSAFKPFVYAAALQQGVPIPTRLVGPGALPYSGTYWPADGVPDTVALDLRDGLRLSSNRAAVVLGSHVGVDAVLQVARAAGIASPIPPYPSSFLGAAALVPLELVAAYSAFGRQGVAVAPRLITRVEDDRGRVLYQAPLEERPVLSPGAAYLTLDLLREVVERGTGAAVRRWLPAEVPAAGKTGTTDEVSDVWFVGLTPDLVAGVWLGFDRPRPIVAGGSGGALAAPVWGQVVAAYYADHPTPAPWPAPSDVVEVAIDRESGKRATAFCPPEQVRRELFLAGTEPTESCPLHPDFGLGGWIQRAFDRLGDWIRGRP